MAIISATSSITGLVGVLPGVIFINTTDSFATVTTAGYLTKAVEEGLISIHVPTAHLPGGTIALVTTTTGAAVLSVVVTGIAPNLIYSLVAPSGSGSIILPTTINHIATYADTIGTLTEDPTTAFTNGNIAAGGFVNAGTNLIAGSDANAGQVFIYPPTTLSGVVVLLAQNNAGNFINRMIFAGQSAGHNFIVPDTGATSSNFLLTNNATTQTIATGNLALTVGTLTLGSSGHASSLTIFPGTASNGSFVISPVNNAGDHISTLSSVTALGQDTVYTLPDPGAATANIMLNTGTTTMAAGSKIVLDKTTGTTSTFAVTISKNAGVITTETMSTAGGASQAITLTNTLIATTSVLLCQLQGGTNTTKNITISAVPGNGSATITIYNNTAATALNGTVIIGFAVF